jgi:SWIM zinc finger
MTSVAEILNFSQALAQAEQCALKALDPGVHGRLRCAVELVKSGAVLQTDDPHLWTVSSASRPGVKHQVNSACSCKDAQYRAPQGLCKHRLSVFLARKMLRLMEAQKQMIPQPLGEAPVSCNAYLMIAGRQVQVTLRGTSEVEVLNRMEKVLRQYPDEMRKAQEWCQIHSTVMKEHTNAKGTWFSHYIDGKHCKGK